MDDLIRRQDAIKLAIDLDYESRGILKESKCREIENRYNMIPSAQKKGHWTNVKISHTRSSADCSECGVTVNDRFCTAVHFCPNCGADMRCKTDTHSRDIIEKLPAAQHRPCCYLDGPCPYQNEEAKDTHKKGHWVENHDSDHAWKCSECGCGYTDSKLSFCYDCGADMRGDQHGNT